MEVLLEGIVGLAVHNDALKLKVGACFWAVVLLVWVLTQLQSHSSGLSQGVDVRVVFRSIGDLGAGAPLRVAGQTIGEVVSIGTPTAEGVSITVRIDESYQHYVSQNAEVFVSNEGLFGSRFLEAAPPAKGKPGPPVRAGDVLSGVSPPDIDRFLWRTYRNMTIAREFFDEVRPHVKSFRSALDDINASMDLIAPPGKWDKFRASIGVVASEGGRLADGWEGNTRLGLEAVTGRGRRVAAVLGSMTESSKEDIRQIQQNLAPLRGAGLSKMRHKLSGAFTRSEDLWNQVQDILANAREMVERIQRGEGTIGALWNDPEFSDEAKRIGRVIKRSPWRVLWRPKDE